ncbi:MAG TPA: thioesterase family protein [Mycobacterium sp.]
MAESTTPPVVRDSESTTGYFSRRGDTFHPQSIARGGWGKSVSGHVVGGLLGWAAERVVDDSAFLPARLTVDLPRPTALEPIDLRTRVLRNGRRLRLVEVVMLQGGEVVAQATGLFLRRGQQPAGTVWSPDIEMPPFPADVQPSDNSLFVRTYGWGMAIQNPEPNWSGEGGEKFTWLRLTQPLIQDEPLTPFTRAAMAADVTASLVNWSSDGLKFINADYTVTLSRLPEGPVIGLAAQGHCSHDGIATGSATIFDQQGKIGHSAAVSLAQTGFLPPSS